MKNPSEFSFQRTILDPTHHQISVLLTNKFDIKSYCLKISAQFCVNNLQKGENAVFMNVEKKQLWGSVQTAGLLVKTAWLKHVAQKRWTVFKGPYRAHFFSAIFFLTFVLTIKIHFLPFVNLYTKMSLQTKGFFPVKRLISKVLKVLQSMLVQKHSFGNISDQKDTK